MQKGTQKKIAPDRRCKRKPLERMIQRAELTQLSQKHYIEAEMSGG